MSDETSDFAAQSSEEREDPTDDLADASSSQQQSQQKTGTRLQRKRTKTGCLTCRKRRIKCGEERPVCANCTKSKRNCEGYTQRVIFKHPLGGYYRPEQGYGPIRPDTTPAGYPAQASGSNGLMRIAPKAYPIPDPAHWGPPEHQNVPSQVYFPPEPLMPAFAHTHIPETLQPLDISFPSVGYSYHLSASNPTHPASQATATQPPQWSGAPAASQQPPSNASVSMSTYFAPTTTNQPYLYTDVNDPLFYPTNSVPSVSPSTFQQNTLPPDEWHHVANASASADNGKALRSTPEDFIPSKQYIGNYIADPTLDSTAGNSRDQPLFQDTLQEDEAEEDDEEDPWDVMDEDLEPPLTATTSMEDLRLLARVRAQPSDLHIRGYKTFLNTPNVLARYRPTYASSPLNDEKTARIFAHFITSTGPSISLFERNITNITALFSGSSVQPSQQGLWTYVLPSMALDNTPLMHAILALGALHIAKLQQTSLGPSIKHFHYALRRVGTLLGLPHRRNEISTVAANLILGFYEVMSAEHSKWSIHLAGAKILIMEMDLATKTTTIRRMRDQAKAMIAKMSPPPDMVYRDIWRHTGYGEDLLDPLDWEIDDTLVSELSGLHVSFNDSNERIPSTGIMTEKDIHDYKIRSDLFWWYCKQDVFQSMISGNALLMPYEHWVTNPPRAQFGRHDALYGTFDHIMLLMARLTDWGAKDRRRKMKVMAANGGQWRPPPGFFPSRPGGKGGPPGPGGPPPGQGPPSAGARGPPGAKPAMPTFHGMMPPKPAHMESAYASVATNLQDPYRASNVAHVTTSQEPLLANQFPSHYVPPRSMDTNTTAQQHYGLNETSEPVQTLETLTEKALTEHAAISRAFELFHASLPSTFAPLSPNQSPQIASPFGPAIQYRTHFVACIHLFYHCGLLLLARLHPQMPPATMAATVISAFKTAGTAQIMGRIVGGLYHAVDDTTPRFTTPDDRRFKTGPANAWASTTPQTGDMNPISGAALTETTFPMFFAAVQYTDAEQRRWIIGKLRAIARIAGWESSAAIAAGCEAAWQKMGMGQTGGPPSSAPQAAPTDVTAATSQPLSGLPHDPRSRHRPATLHHTTSTGSVPASSQFPAYIPTMKDKTNDERIALVFRDREKLLRAQQQQQQQQQQYPQHTAHGAYQAAINTSDLNRPGLGPRWASEGGFANLSAPQVGEAPSQRPQQLAGDEDNDDLPRDDTTPLPINHDRRFIGTNPNARVHWALGILGLEKDLRDLDMN